MEHISFNIKLQQGDEQAFKQLFESEYRPLLAYLTSLTRDHAQAQDLTQQAFLRFWEKRKTLNVNQTPKQYLFSIGHNLFIDYYRRSNTRMEIIANLKHRALQEQFEETPSDHLQTRIDKLHTIIEQLPPRCKEVLKLNKFEGLKYQEIADYLHISKKTVENQMGLAFQKIREHFKNDDELILFILFNFLKNKEHGIYRN
jgi:RNA polymerase sigma-70 factor (ECF subfamily)